MPMQRLIKKVTNGVISLGARRFKPLLYEFSIFIIHKVKMVKMNVYSNLTP